MKRFNLLTAGTRREAGRAMENEQTNQPKPPASRSATIRTGKGRVTGYIEVFLTTRSQYVTIPGASRFRDVSITSESHARLEAL
jgi:hypothetical protein